MGESELALSFEEITEADIPELTGVMTRAFDDDSRIHRGLDRGGPEGYDNGDFFRKWLFGYEQTRGYKIVVEGRIIGGCIVWILETGRNYVGTIFVDPAWQNRGVASRAWAFIESRYPETKSWTLETPVWATRNHHFYENKCGFRKLETREDAVVYRKEMGEGTA